MSTYQRPSSHSDETLLTFLLTDVEGSTTLWREHETSMGAALDLHDRIIEDGVVGMGGDFLKHRGEGDSTFSVFTDPIDAVRAALRLQLSLHEVNWPVEVTLKVRAALHTGPAKRTHMDYLGSTVNFCARLRSLAHGGQTLVSSATADAIDGRVPAPGDLKDLGDYPLRGFTGRHQVFQLVHPRLPREFGPLHTGVTARRRRLATHLGAAAAGSLAGSAATAWADRSTPDEQTEDDAGRRQDPSIDLPDDLVRPDEEALDDGVSGVGDQDAEFDTGFDLPDDSPDSPDLFD